MSFAPKKKKPQATNTSKKNDLFNKPTVQAKLKIGAVNDPAEKEADQKADSIVSPKLNHFGEPAFIQPVSPIQTKINNALSEKLSPSKDFESNLKSSKGGGQKMDNGTKSEMESGFGKNLSNVNIHTDSNAVQMNQDIGAKAFTNGSDIYFNEGNYNPSSKEGKHLLAHELTHTAQQGATGGKANNTVQRKAETIQKKAVGDETVTAGGFDKKSASHVSAMDKHIASRIKEINEKIQTSQNSIDELEKKTERTDEENTSLTAHQDFKGIMESYLAEMKTAESEFTTMKTSTQLFKIRPSKVAGQVTYTDADKSVKIEYSKHLYRLGHELKHGYDYLIGKITFNKEEGSVGVTADLGDETRGYRREIAMGAPWAKDRSLDIITNEKVKNQTEGEEKPYENLPDKDIDVNSPNINLDKDAVFKK
jgi:hypothetical protein